MDRYQPVPNLSWAYLCLDCGCLIGRRAAHDRFHDRTDSQRADEAFERDVLASEEATDG